MKIMNFQYFILFIEKENGMTKKVHIWAGKEKEEH